MRGRLLGDTMLFEDNTYVFTVRIWLEPREIEGASPEWRGVVEHVPSGKRRYIQALDDIPPFIAPYLEAMGVNISNQWSMEDGSRN